MTGSPAALGLTTFRGLPAHILIVHVVVVLVPLSGVLAIAALRPRYAARLGIWLPVVSVVALLSVFAAMNAGGWLQHHVRDTALVRAHTSIAGQLWPFSAAVAALSLVVWWLSGRTSGADSAVRTPSGAGAGLGSSKTMVLVAVLVVAASVGSIVEVVRIGESGSRAAWIGHFSTSGT